MKYINLQHGNNKGFGNHIEEYQSYQPLLGEAHLLCMYNVHFFTTSTKKLTNKKIKLISTALNKNPIDLS